MEKQAEEHKRAKKHRQSEENKRTEELRLYGEIASKVAVMLTDSLEEWTAFLTAAGRLYKWPYEDQLLIYAQRPDATACADYAVWNRLNRYIRRGSDAIVLIDNSGASPALRYVFDFSDTKSGANGRTPWFWEYRDNQHYSAVSAALDRQFGKSRETDMAARLDELSEHLSQEYWNDHKEEILESVDGSFLEDFDPLNVEMAFCHAASVSIAWTLMSRCNLEPEEYFQRQDFENVFEFNTPAAIAALGCAVSESTEKVLREIETAVKGCEREKRKERNVQNGPATGVQTGGRLPYPGRSAGGQPGQAAGQIRSDAQRVPASAPARPVGTAVYQRGIVPPLPGNRGRGQPPYGGHTARPDAVGWRG